MKFGSFFSSFCENDDFSKCIFSRKSCSIDEIVLMLLMFLTCLVNLMIVIHCFSMAHRVYCWKDFPNRLRFPFIFYLMNVWQLKECLSYGYNIFVFPTNICGSKSDIHRFNFCSPPTMQNLIKKKSANIAIQMLFKKRPV